MTIAIATTKITKIENSFNENEIINFIERQQQKNYIEKYLCFSIWNYSTHT